MLTRIWSNLQRGSSSDCPKTMAIRCKTLKSATINKQHRNCFSIRQSLALFSSQTTDHYIIATQYAQSARQGHAFQTLLKLITKHQALQTAWQGHMFQTLVEAISQSQVLQTVGQDHAFQTLVEFLCKSQTDKAFWKVETAKWRWGCQVCNPFQGKLCSRDVEPH